MSQMQLQVLSLIFLGALSGFANAAGSSFLGKSDQVTTAEVETSLLAELSGNVSSRRLHELEEALRPMYAALPKGPTGFLGHQAVRYALHRLLLQRHGWFIVGLEPSDEARPPYLDGEWVPEYLQGLLEQRLGSRGMDLHEIAALAAAMEDLVRAEAGRRVDLVYDRLGVAPEKRLDSGEADRLLETFMMLYLNGGNFTSEQALRPELALELFKQDYADWGNAASWLQEIKGRHLSATTERTLDHNAVVDIANELGERFGTFNDGECRSLKQQLLELEGPRPGRVPLVDFYNRGLYSHWQFNEKIDYLRTLGALDESEQRPSVILPNYVGSRPNCLAASGLYAVCCRNECEDLMGRLESQIAGPTASPETIHSLVSQLSSDTVKAPRELPEALRRRLGEMASRHGGQVPLHGRLFAQFMHHAFPRECPYPHEGASPQTPDEWMREAEDDVRQVVSACTSEGCTRATQAEEAALPAELPWTDAEKLLEVGHVQQGGFRPEFLLLLLVPALLFAPVAVRLSPSQIMTASASNWEEQDDCDKPARQARRQQQIKVIVALVGGGLLLDFIGILDHFSFACTLCGGLLLNIGLPLLLQNSNEPAHKSAKCCV